MKRFLLALLAGTVILSGLLISLGLGAHPVLGRHQTILSSVCLGPGCSSFLREVACSAHCLTSGLLSGSSVLVGPVFLLPLLLAVGLVVASAASRFGIFGYLALLGLPPPLVAVRIIVRLE